MQIHKTKWPTGTVRNVSLIHQLMTPVLYIHVLEGKWKRLREMFDSFLLDSIIIIIVIIWIF